MYLLPPRATRLLTGACVAILIAFVARGASPEQSSKRTEITRASVLAAMNDARAKHHLPPYREDDRLDRAARTRMDDMELDGYWGHYPPDGSNPFALLRLNGYDYRLAGENLARGVESAELLVEEWLGSPGHRENVLSPDYTDVGIAFIVGGTTGRVQGKSVIVIFAKEKGVVRRPKH